MSTGSRPPWRVAAIVACGLFVFFALRFLAHSVEGIDDAYISFRYARNLVEGHGLVYNPGEPPVQGYTNFLWTVGVALAMAVGLPPLPVALGVGFLSGLFIVAATARQAFVQVAPGRASAALGPALLACNLGLVVWCLRGLETGFFTALVLGAALSYLRRGAGDPFPLPAAVLLALAALTRPEGLLFAALIGVHAAAGRMRAGKIVISRRDLPAVGILAGALGLYGAWAVWAYGSLLPNTFHAKVGGPLDSAGRGWVYLDRFLGLGRTGAGFPGYGTAWPLYLLPACFLPGRRRDATRSLSVLLVTGVTLYVVLVGGDVFPAYRFLVPIFPFLYLLVTDAAAALEERVSRRLADGVPQAALRVAVAGLAVLLALGTFRPSWTFAWREWDGGNRFTTSLRMVGRWLGEHLPGDATIALNPAGALPYEARLHTIDMLGLNDREIARTPVEGLGGGRLAGHEKGNGASVFRRKPDVILIGGVKLDGKPGWTPHGRSERELREQPDLMRVYRLEHHRMPDGRTLTFLGLRSSDPGRRAKPQQ